MFYLIVIVSYLYHYSIHLLFFRSSSLCFYNNFHSYSYCLWIIFPHNHFNLHIVIFYTTYLIISTTQSYQHPLATQNILCFLHFLSFFFTTGPNLVSIKVFVFILHHHPCSELHLIKDFLILKIVNKYLETKVEKSHIFSVKCTS